MTLPNSSPETLRPEPAPPPTQRGARRWSHLKWVLLAAAGAAAVLAAALLLGRDVFIAPRLAALIQETVRAELGLEVTVGGVGGSLLRDIEITEVRTVASDGSGPVAAIAVRRLSARYSLLSAFKGVAGFLTDAILEIDGLRLDIDLSRPAPTPAAPAEHAESTPVAIVIPTVRLRDAALSVRGEGFRTDFTGLRLDADPAIPGQVRVQLQVDQWSWSHPGLRPGSAALSAAGTVGPESIRLERLLVDDQPLFTRAEIGLPSTSGPTPFAADLRLAGGSATLDGTLADSALTLRLKADRLDLARLCSIFDLDGVSLAGSLSLDSGFTLPPEGVEAAAGHLDLSVSEAAILGADVLKADLKSSLADGRLQVERLTVTSAKSRLQASNVAAPLGLVLGGRLQPLIQALSGQLELDSEDLPALLAIAGVRTEIPSGKVPKHRLTFEGRLDAGTVSIARAGLTSDANRILVRNLTTAVQEDMAAAPLTADLQIELPELDRIAPLLALPPLAGSLRGELSVSGTLGNPTGLAHITAENLSIDKLPLGRLSVQATAGRQAIHVASATLQRGSDRLAGKGTIRLAERRIEAAEVDFTFSDIEPLMRLVLPGSWVIAGERPRFNGALKGQARVTGPWENPDARLSFDFKGLHIRGVGFGDGSGTIGWRDNRLTAGPFTVADGNDFLKLDGSYDFSENSFGATRIALSAADIGRYCDVFLPDAGWFAGATAGTLEGSGSLLTPDFMLELTVGRSRAGGINLAETRLKARGEGRRVRIEALETKTPRADLSLAGALERGPADAMVDLTLERLRLAPPGASFDLEREAHLRWSRPGVFTINGFRLGGEQGRVAVEGTLASGAVSDLNARVEGLKGGDWLRALTGSPVDLDGFDATLRAKGPPGGLVISLAGDVARLGAVGAPVSYAGRFDLEFAAGTLRLRSIEMTGPGNHRIEMTGTLPIDTAHGFAPGPGALTLQARARVPDLGSLSTLAPSWPITGGTADAELTLAGTWRAPEGSLRLNANGAMPARDTGLIPPGPYTATVEARLEQSRLTVGRLEVDGPHASLKGAGSWEGLPDITRLAGGGTQAGAGRLALQAGLKIADLGWLGRGLKDIRRTAGALEASLTLTGPPRDPEITAEIRLSGGELWPELALPSVQDLNLEARTDGRQLEIVSLNGDLGGAPFQLQGTIAGIRALATEGRTDFKFTGDNLLLFRSDETTLRADTRLTLSGPVSRLLLEGEVAVTDGRFAKNLGVFNTLLSPGKPAGPGGLRLFSINAPPLRDMRFNVKITARRPFQIRSNVARGEVRPDLLLAGTGQLPALTGVVYVEPSRVTLPAGRIEIESGLVRFLTSDPDRPVLDLNGRSRLYGYDITVLIEGPYDAPEITLSSVPPLPREDLLLMLLTGQPPRHTGGQGGAERTGMKVAVFVGRDFISRWFQGENGEGVDSILERFDVEVGRALTEAGDETIEASFRLVDGFLRRRGTLYLTGEKDIYDYYNAGVRLVFRFK